MLKKIDTMRLSVRPLTIEDAPSIAKLFNQADCLKYIGNKGITDHQAAIEYLENGPLKSYQQHQLGLMAVTLNNNEFVGTCGLLVREQFEHPDLGFAFLSEFQGKGYAKEACLAVLENYQDIQTLLAFTHLDNQASQKLLTAIGFVRQKNITFDAQPSDNTTNKPVEQSAYFELKR